MPVIVIVGGQWGDEGKGKIVDLLAEKAHMVARFSGGTNAGHTVVNPYGEFRMRLVPSGIFYPYVMCIIGNGVVVDPAVLLEEIEQLQKRGVTTSKLMVSERAHLIMPYHIILDDLEERHRGSKALGTTRKGVGPAYVDKFARLGIRVGELQDKEVFYQRLRSVLEQKNALLTRVYGVSPLSTEEIYSEYCRYGDKLYPYIRETEPLIQGAADEGKTILLEGAQGTLLDVDFGTYPYVTSSFPISGGACVGLGLSPLKIERIIGVFKSYITRVGGGPMPTELKDETGELIRQRAHEFGTTTGRPRRCGWFDAVAARFSIRINGVTSIALTRLDVLDVFPSIKICVGYEVGQQKVPSFPSSSAFLEKCQPIYEEIAGWQTSISNVRRFADLPPAARSYIRRIEQLLGCPVDLVSVGAHREQTILMNPPI